MALSLPDDEIIYIPIWLDLLYLLLANCKNINPYLHSNMVRFIMIFYSFEIYLFLLFTFQYG
mgnify:CR=1 FL=1